MNIVRAFIEGLSWCQRYLFSTLHLHHNGALQYVLALAGFRVRRVNIESSRPRPRDRLTRVRLGRRLTPWDVPGR